MIDFISDNFILCITAVYVLLGMIMSIKLKSSDMKIVDKYGKNFAEIPFRIRHRILLNGKWIKIQYAITVVLIYAVMLVRLNEIFPLPLAALAALPVSLLLAFVFFEGILFVSAFARKLISVNSASLNVMFSSIIFILASLCTYFTTREKLDFCQFILSQICLGCCYVMMLFVLILILKEANSGDSLLTFRNIWKSAFLTIMLFIVVLSLMSYCCLMHNANAFAGVKYGLADIFYYTAITFATVGYGDIVPVSLAAKSVSVLTVITSILCITVLLSEIAGLKKRSDDKR
ncbi:ion channel [Ruminococcus sp.]|uniref:ion channel n=1 Tax=Ruminococcus sp. TaxID=41978 RepID=UPI00260329F1|nr:ion channel [Ruminococcus sp.]MDD6989927.1 ion channel [Ruminococcus sp.]MDY6202258.1 ion channel [Ruminococcus sp.]